MTGQVLPNVATPEQDRAGDGAPVTGSGTTGREAGTVVRLIARGVPNSEACRIVGINRRTGTRWRFGRTITSSRGKSVHYAPVISTPAPEISPRFLSEDERIKIADLHRAGHGVRDIAARTGRSPATISRELRRNRDSSAVGTTPTTGTSEQSHPGPANTDPYNPSGTTELT